MRLVSVPSITAEEVSSLVAEVLAGEELLLFGGNGPLLSALHLTLFEPAIEGDLCPLLPDLPPGPPSAYHAITGVGYALYRCGESTVALYGPRGDGSVLLAGCATENDPLLHACRDWFSRKTKVLVRSKEVDG